MFDANDGIVKICSLENTAESGAMPVQKLVAAGEEYFEKRSISQSRQYLAKGATEQVDMVIRIWNENVHPKIGMFVVLSNYNEQENGDGDQFRIDNVQPLLNADGLEVYDLTLRRLEDRYDVVAG